MTAALISECLLDVTDEDVSNIGIYVIVSESGRFYVGQSSNLKKREYEHFRTLRNNTHSNRYLQNSFNKYGYLDFYVIEYHYHPWQLDVREQFWIDFLDSHLDGMNLAPVASSTLGCVRTKEMREATSRVSKEFWGKDENRKAQSERKKRFFEDNPDALLRMSTTAKRVLAENPDRCKRHSELMIERSNEPENVKAFTQRMATWRDNLSEEDSAEIYKRSSETRRNQSEEYKEQIRLKTNLTNLKTSSRDSYLAWYVGKTRSGTLRLDAGFRWTELSGKNKFKKFSVAKYGLLPAMKMAIDFKEIIITRLIEEYTKVLSE